MGRRGHTLQRRLEAKTVEILNGRQMFPDLIMVLHRMSVKKSEDMGED